MSGFQDMPPPGGYAHINVTRVPPKPLIRQGIWAAVIVALTFNGYQVMRRLRRSNQVRRLEQCEHYIAVHPFLLAEQERKFLKHLRVIREEERELMKDHAGWRLGTLYGEPVFKTLPRDQLPPVASIDFAAFRPENEWYRYVVNPAIMN